MLVECWWAYKRTKSSGINTLTHKSHPLQIMCHLSSTINWPGTKISSTSLLLAPQILPIAPRSWFVPPMFLWWQFGCRRSPVRIVRLFLMPRSISLAFLAMLNVVLMCQTRSQRRVLVSSLAMLPSRWSLSKLHHLSYESCTRYLLAKFGQNVSELVLRLNLIHYYLTVLDRIFEIQKFWLGFFCCTVVGISRQMWCSSWVGKTRRYFNCQPA